MTAHEGAVITFLRFYQSQQTLRAKYIAHLLRNWLLTESTDDFGCYLLLSKYKSFDEAVFRDAVHRAEELIKTSSEVVDRLPPNLRDLTYPRPRGRPA